MMRMKQMFVYFAAAHDVQPSGQCRAAYRFDHSPNYRDFNFGFRVVRPPSLKSLNTGGA